MRPLAIAAFALALWPSAAPAQNKPTDPNGAADRSTGVVGAATKPDYQPLTASERWRLYFRSTFGPGAILRAAASGGVAQASNTPKEWHQGAEAFGERVGNSFAEHVIRKTLESGGAAVLHEDNRYYRSTETGVWKRSKHVVASLFISKNEAGQDHFAYSRFGGAIGASFISRIWQPPSKNTSGDAAENFGLTMGVDLAWHAVKEFAPKRFRRQ